MLLKDLIKQPGPFVADGAMGTYYSQLTGMPASRCEAANIEHPECIAGIHRSYLDAGACLIRTNTFSANTLALGLPLPEVLEIVRSGYQIAQKEAGEQAVVAADLGMIYPEGDEQADPLPEYFALADAFLACGARTFLFETLAEIKPLLPVFSYLREKCPDVEIMVSFSITPDGRTRAGIPLSQLLVELENLESPVSAVGLNCGCGPMHLFSHGVSLLRWSRSHGNLPVFILPNAGYPSVEQQRTVFNTSPEYFAVKTAEIAAAGAFLVGGCCGTTPDHIRRLAQMLGEQRSPALVSAPSGRSPSPVPPPRQDAFSRKLQKGEFLLASELDPPYGTDLSKLLSAAQRLKDAQVDAITISDSPLARVKLDSVVCAAKIRREVGISTLPHLCCRDKNANALRASLLGAHCEGIRAVLAVTGDHVPECDRGYVKPVFNVTSIKLMENIQQMNSDVFADSPFSIGGALNPLIPRVESELKRVKRKMDAGASFFLTQPVFCDSFDLIDGARAMGAKVLVGIMPLVSFRNAWYMSNEVPGIHIPESYLSRFSPDMGREEAAQVGVEIAVEIARMARSHADGFYFMTPFNRAEIICDILTQLRQESFL